MPDQPSRRTLLGAAAGLSAGALAVGLSACDRPEPAAPTARHTATPEPEAPLFDADYARRGFGAYASFAPQDTRDGVDRGIDKDPLGERGRVAWFDSRRRLHVGTPFPRSSALTGPLIVPGQERWVMFDVLVPPESAPAAADDWQALGTGAFGAPFQDTSPLGLAVVRSRTGELYLQMGADYTLLGERISFPVGTWVRIVQGFTFAGDGWAEVLMGPSGGELESIGPEGKGTGRFALASRTEHINGAGDNAARVGVYGTAPARLWFAAHRVARTREAVLAGL